MNCELAKAAASEATGMSQEAHTAVVEAVERGCEAPERVSDIINSVGWVVMMAIFVWKML